MTADPTRSGPIENDFCAGCGLCCDGTLFGQVRVTMDEGRRLSAIGHELFDQAGERHFRQPCPSLKHGRCSIYEARPRSCQKFNCKLLERHHKGDLEPGEGPRRVTEAKALQEQVRACEPDAAYDGKRQTRWRSLAAELEAAPVEDKLQIGQRLLAVVAFETYLSLWFRKKRD